jgi:hypothetical protein
MVWRERPVVREIALRGAPCDAKVASADVVDFGAVSAV